MSKTNDVEYISDDDNIDQYNNVDIESDIGDNDIEDNDNDELPISKKDSTEVDNDDNENDYIDDENDDADDETYEPDDENDEDEDYNHNYIEDNINFNDNENENDMKCEIIVKSENRITSNILSIYEYIELISIRASQITNGSFVFTDVIGLSDPLEMAKKEVIDNKCPLYVKRHIGLNRYELWSPNVMSKPKI
jgi:DNA-directed RNA polymerase subunit K/omega